MKRATMRWSLTALVSVAAIVSSYAQSAQVIYEQDDNFPTGVTEFRSPWNGGNVGNNNFMPAPTGRIIATNDIIGTTFVIRVRLQNFTGGDPFGRLALMAGNGFRRTGIAWRSFKWARTCQSIGNGGLRYLGRFGASVRIACGSKR